MKNIDKYVDEYHSLQVVMSYASDHQYRIRCLPGFLDTSYLNTHIFDGSGRPGSTKEEIYRKSCVRKLDDDGGQMALKEQLYALFLTRGVDMTFSYLTKVAEEGVQNFYLHEKLSRPVMIESKVDYFVMQEAAKILDFFSTGRQLLLHEVVTHMTFEVLGGMPMLRGKTR